MNVGKRKGKSMSNVERFALVSTVDTMGEEFPGHCVMLFDTEREAIFHAVKCIVEHDDTVEYVEEEALWTMGEEHFDDAQDLLNAWQDGLDLTEFFHVLPVKGPVVRLK